MITLTYLTLFWFPLYESYKLFIRFKQHVLQHKIIDILTQVCITNALSMPFS